MERKLLEKYSNHKRSRALKLYNEKIYYNHHNHNSDYERIRISSNNK